LQASAAGILKAAPR